MPLIAHTLYQVSTATALVEGIYQGAVPIAALLKDGDLGLGTFEDLHTRAMRGTSEGVPLVKAAAVQPEFEFHEVGTLVRFWTPGYAKTLNVPGYHLHFNSRRPPPAVPRNKFASTDSTRGRLPHRVPRDCGFCKS